MHFNLIFVHSPVAVQTILRGLDTGVYPCLQDSGTSTPGLKNCWSPAISILPVSSGLKHPGKRKGFIVHSVKVLKK